MSFHQEIERYLLNSRIGLVFNIFDILKNLNNEFFSLLINFYLEVFAKMRNSFLVMPCL